MREGTEGTMVRSTRKEVQKIPQDEKQSTKLTETVKIYDKSLKGYSFPWEDLFDKRVGSVEPLR